MKQIQQLRCIALKLGVSGTAVPISETRLYKGSYGFVKLQVYVPKTQNTEAPVCTVYSTTTDELGREKISSHNYNLIYVEECELDDMSYLLFESMLPKEFTHTTTSSNGLKITFNYYDTAVTVDAQGNAILDENGVPKRHTTDLLVSSIYTTTVYPGGWNNEDIELGINSTEAGQIAENMRNIAEIQDQMDDIKEIADGTHADSSEALSTAREAKATADSLADSAAQANTAAGQAVETANNAVEDMAKYKSDTDNNMAQFKQSVNDEIAEFESVADGKMADANAKASEALSTANQAKETADELTVSIAQANTTAGEAKEIAEEALEQSKITGTKVNVNGEFQTELNFKNDPQGQIDDLEVTDAELQEEIDVLKSADISLQNGKVNRSGDTMTGDLTVEKAQSGARFIAKTAKNGEGIQIGVNGDDASTGIWDLKREKWLMQNIDGTVYIDGKVPLPISGGTMTGDLTVPTLISGGFKQRDTSKDYLDLVDGKGANFGLGGLAGNIYRLQQMLRTDPTKLEPTTANGWTVGDLRLAISSTGIYMVSINNNVPFLLIVPKIPTAGAYNINFVAGYGTQQAGVGRALFLGGNIAWYLTDIEKKTSIDVTSVAYKKLA